MFNAENQPRMQTEKAESGKRESGNGQSAWRSVFEFPLSAFRFSAKSVFIRG